MTEVFCRQINGALHGVSEADREAIKSIPLKDEVRVKWTRPRNLQFHKKWFALVKFGFDVWEPAIDESFEAKYGAQPEKNFDRFRKDIVILAGFRDAHVNIKGEVKYEAQSISFASMDEDTFAELYEKTKNVVWSRVISQIDNWTPEEFDNVLAQLGDFE